MTTPRAQTIVDVVRLRASRDANRPAYTYLSKDGQRTLTYAALEARIRAIAAVLAARLPRQERALLMYASGLDFIEAFWACMYANLVPVPVYSPQVNGQGLARLTTIARDCAPGLVLTTQAHLDEAGGLLAGLVGGIPAIATDAIPGDAAHEWRPLRIGASDTALLQYSSGSTSSPKGIIVTHANVLANQAMVKQSFRHSRATTFAGWLPFFHDMGLFGGIVQPMFVGAHSVLMPPSLFLQQPIRWLQAISDYRAHTSGGPNFAYDYCVRRITDEEKEGLDLRRWKRAFNGAEKPRADTMRRFAAAFARCGFREAQFYPCYGLAEATLFVSGRDTIQAPGIARESDGRVTNVSSGRTWLQQRIAIVEPETRTLLDDGAIGEIWVKGPHVAVAYWGRPALSEATFGAFLADGSDGPFLRTGDLGFLRDGELFVVGRLKDLIIIRGQNFHPEDIEAAVERSHRAVEPGGCAAFAVEPRDSRDGGQERLVLLIEVSKALVRSDVLQELCDSAAAAVSAAFGIVVGDVVVVRRGTIPKTSSGKIQRFRCRDGYLAGELDPVKTVRYDVDADVAAEVDPAASADLARALTAADRGARQALIRNGLATRLRSLIAPAAHEGSAAAASPIQMGLDSVRALQVKHWIERATNVSLSIAELFDARSLDDLADLIAGRMTGAAAADRTAVAVADAGAATGAAAEARAGLVSHGQRALFFEHEKAPNAASNISVALRLMGPIDRDRLARAVSALAARHPQLTARFFRDGGGVRQQIRPGGESTALAHVDASGSTDVQLRQEVDRRANQPFDLGESAVRFVSFASSDVSQVLLIVVHHILIDWFSLETLIGELAALYAAAAPDAAGNVAGDVARNAEAALPAVPAAYEEFTSWEASWLASPRGEESLQFWRRLLAGRRPAARLPFCSSRSDYDGRRGRMHAFAIDPRLRVAVRDCAAREHATPSMVMLSAFAVLLTQFAREHQVMLGATVAGRPSDRFADALGYFANVLPLPLDIDPAQPFVRIVEQVRTLMIRALDHQQYPFSLLKEKLGAEQAPDPVLIRHCFTYAEARHDDSVLGLLQDDPAVRIPFGPLTATGFAIERQMAPFDITLMMFEWNGALHGAFSYAENRVDAAAIGTFADAFVTLLSALVRQSSAPILRVSLEPERPAAALEGALAAARAGAALERGEASFRSVFERFETQAREQPDAIALVYQDEQVTYRELQQRAARLGARLRAAGVGPEVVVAVYCPRSIEMIVAIAAILAAGGAYVPIDVTYPEERLRLIIEDARARLALTLPQYAGPCERAGAAPILIDAESAPPSPASAVPLAATSAATLVTSAAATMTAPNSAAYIIYTSGSTGRPKGVAVTHASIAALYDSARHHREFGRHDVWTMVHSVSFDVSVWETWGALSHGGKLIVLDRDGTRDPVRLYRHIVEQQVTLFSATPSALYNLLPVVRAQGASQCPLPLRHVVCAGEALKVSHREAWFETTWPAVTTLINMYGITETTVHTTWAEARPEPQADESSSDIGLPLDGEDLYMLSAGHHRLPAYALGEIGVGGVGLARGYLYQPALTASRFVPDPYSAIPGARLYLSGDLAYRQGSDGRFRYVGRADSQVKVRGHRIELSDIEANLQRCEHVDWAMVTAAVEADGHTTLTAYLRCRDDLTVTMVREHLGQRVPDYMVPNRLLRVETVPTTENGKVDIAKLRLLAAPLPSEEAYRAPRTDAERTMTAIWADVLGFGRVGIDDNYFALGGDSIRSIQIVSKARAAGMNVALPDLLLNQTVRRVVGAVSPAATREPRGGSEPFALVSAEDRGRLPADLVDAFPVSRLLQGLIFHSEFSDDYLVYVTSVRIGLPYDRACVEQAIRATVARHPFLRSSIDTGTHSEPLQLVHAAAEVAVTSHDIRERAPAEQEREIRAWVDAETLKKFDWSRAPLLRFAIHWRAADSFQITLSEPFLDGWCVALLYRELLLTYGTLLRGEALPARAATEIGQRHFVALERHAAQDQRHREFWARYVARCPRSLLPADHRDGPSQTLHGRESLVVSGAMLARIDAVARAASVPSRSVMMAVHGLVLSCLLGTPDVTFGVIHNGRPEEGDADEAIGSFLNTVPFTMTVAAGESWVDYASRVFAAECEIVPFRRFPFAEIRALGGHDVFDAVFNYTHFHVLESKGGRDDLGVRELGASEQTYFPLTAHFNRSTIGDGLDCLLDYDARRLSGARIAHLADAYRIALEALAADASEAGGVARAAARVEARLFPAPAATVASAAIAAAHAEAQPASASGAATALELFERIAAERPDTIALVMGDLCLTYRQVRRRAEALARRLRSELAIGPDDLVGVHATHSCHAMIAILGILEAGAAYVPLDEDCPAERLAFIMADCRMRAVVAEPACAARFAPFDLQVLHVDESPIAAPTAAGPALPAAAPSALAYVMYTSGSTGTPKGVGISHQAVAHLAHAAIREYAVVPDDRILQFCTLEFDISVEEIVMALCAGAALVMRPRDLLDSYDAFHGYCAREGITCLNVPTAFWNDWVHELVTTGRPFDVPVRQVIIAGEQMRPELAWQWTSAVPPHVQLVNTYGPTEATVKASKYPVHISERPAAGASASSPIGVGFGETTLSVLDPRLRPLPSGVTGELHLGGPAVARGYMNRPRLTAERFIPDAWGAPGATCYRTGDLAFIGADGGVQFVGRIDRQVKITGYRVEPEELESALMDCAGVRQAAVTVERAARGVVLLHAYVRLDGDCAGDTRQAEQRLREHLAGRVPRYMMPSTLFIVDRLPMTLSGKVDRTRLAPRQTPWQTPLSSADERHQEADAPARQRVRDLIAAAYAECLNVSRVRAEDDFFLLGGDSLKAMRVVSRLRHSLRGAVSVRDLFEYPRVDRLAHVLHARIPSSGAEAAAESENAAPVLSFSQERMWMAEQLAPGAAPYNLAAAIVMKGPLNAGAFEQSVGEVRRRHSVLRTRVVMRDGVLIPQLSDTPETTITHLDLRAIARAASRRELIALGSAFARARYDLERDAPLRMALCALGDDEHLLLISIHHIVADGWSIGLLIDELMTLYAAYRRGGPSPLPELSIQYVDFARRQRAKMDGVHRQQLREYWLRALADLPDEGTLPIDYMRPAVTTFRGDRYYFTVPNETVEAIGALSRGESVTPFIILLTAYLILLHRRSGQTDLVVGTPVSTRDWPDTEPLIGMFVNQLVIRADLAGQPTCRQLLRRVRNAVLSAYDHRDLPFEDLVQMLRPRRSVASLPLVQTLFAYRDRPWQDIHIEALDVEYLEVHNGAAKYDLEVQMIDRLDGGYQGYFEFNTDLFSAATIEALAADYVRALRTVVEQRDCSIAAERLDRASTAVTAD